MEAERLVELGWPGYFDSSSGLGDPVLENKMSQSWRKHLTLPSGLHTHTRVCVCVCVCVRARARAYWLFETRFFCTALAVLELTL